MFAMNLELGSLAEWVSALSTVVATLIAAIVARRGYKEYLEPLEQENDPEAATLEALPPSPEELLVFKTSKQKTYLIAKGDRIECHLHDTRPNRGGHQWTLSGNEISRILQLGDYAVNPGYRARTGMFSIGSHKNWLYSKQLFPEPEYLHGALTDLMTKTIARA